MKAHGTIIKALLRDLLREEIEAYSDGEPTSELVNIAILMDLCESDRAALLAAARKKLRRLEQATKIFGGPRRDWRGALENQ